MNEIDQLTLKTNLLFSLVDVVETLLMEMEHDMRLQRREMHFSTKRNFNMAIRGVRGLKSLVKQTSEETQVAFGCDAYILYALIMLIVDRTGEDDMKTFSLYNYIKAMPSVCGMKLDIDERLVFGHVLEGKEDGQ